MKVEVHEKRMAAQQPDAADEVGALQGRFAPPSQLIRVLGGHGEAEK